MAKRSSLLCGDRDDPLRCPFQLQTSLGVFVTLHLRVGSIAPVGIMVHGQTGNLTHSPSVQANDAVVVGLASATPRVLCRAVPIPVGGHSPENGVIALVTKCAGDDVAIPQIVPMDPKEQRVFVRYPTP